MIDLAAAVVWLLIVLVLGRAILRRAIGEPAIPAADLTLLGFGVGAATVSLAVLLLGAFHLYRTPYLLGIAGLAAAISAREWSRLADELRAAMHSPARRARTAVGLAVGAAALVPLSLALCPPFAKDALVYHLAVPKLFLQAGGLRYIPGNLYSNFPLGVEMLFLPPMAVGLDRVPALIHLAFAIFSALLVYRLSARHCAPPVACVLAAAFAWTPSVLVSAGWPYVDLAVVYGVLASFLALLLFQERGGRPLVAAAGLLAGLAFSAKYTGGFAIAAGALLVLLDARRTGRAARAAVTDLVVYGAAAAGIVAPWLIKNVVFTGNPLYPFLYVIFGGRDWDVFQADTFAGFLSDFGMGRSGLATLLLPFNLTFRAQWEGARFDGRIGVFYLAALAPFAVLLARRRFRAGPACHAIGLWLAYGLFWFFATQQVRFLLPALALFLVALGALAADLRETPRLRLGAWALLPAIALGNLASAAPVLDQIRPWRWLAGQETKTEFLDRVLQIHPVIRYANAHLPADAKLLLLQVGNRGYYLERAYYSDSVVEVAYLDRLIRESDSPAGLRDRLVADGFTHLLLNEKYVARPFTGRPLEVLGAFFRGYTDSLFFSRPYRLVAIRIGTPNAPPPPPAAAEAEP